MKNTLLPALLAFGMLAFAPLKAQNPPTPTPEADPIKSYESLQGLQKASFVHQTEFESLGPSIMSGRVVDLAVNPERPEEYYVAYATAGVWYTCNNGTTFEPILDNAPTINVGDIAVDWKNSIIWVGTGENNSSRSSYSGIGMLKSSDRGETWEHLGLTDSHHIGRIRLHPSNPDIAVVAVTGHLYSQNEERGVYRTEDGGKTWKRTLFVDAGTGAIDLDVDPRNFEVQYAALWERERKAWDFKGSGSASGIYKSTDGGRSWSLVSGKGSGFPNGDSVGRIGLAVYDANTIYAVLDNQGRRPAEKEDNKKTRLERTDFERMDKKEFLKIEEKELEEFLRESGFPRKYTGKGVRDLVEKDSLQPSDIFLYLTDANAQLFDTPVIGAELYLSRDGGSNWTKTHNGYLDDLYYSYGYYFGQVRVNPADLNEVYLLGVPIIKSLDGGKTFEFIGSGNVHSDHHALWINPANGDHLINGNDGGVNTSYDQGNSWTIQNTPKVGQFYSVTLDNAKPYRIYGGLQDNGVWRGAHNAPEDSGWTAGGRYPWERLMGGDGMQVQVDKRDMSRVYTGYQFGNYFRLETASGKRTFIKPRHELGEAPLRFNWETPILLSSHNPDILYFGSNKLYRSFDRGDKWEAISGDLTGGGRKGNVPYGTISSITESPLQFGLMYTGSDDGQVYRTMDGGAHWELLSQDLPGEYWISTVLASTHEKSRVYTSLNGYRWDEFSPYLYLSEDFGSTWKDISGNLPSSPINVVIEDPTNEDLLFAGTDQGVYVSFDRGGEWNLMNSGMPVVAVHDLAIQERESDLVAATHGRSFFRADIGHLQKVDAEFLKGPLHLFELPEIRYRSWWGEQGNAWRKADPPSVDVYYYAGKPGPLSLSVTSEGGEEVYRSSLPEGPGLGRFSYAMVFDPDGLRRFNRKEEKVKQGSDGLFHLPRGKYTLSLISGKNEVSTTLEIK